MKVLKLARHFIDLCFHVYDSPSIKDDKRGNEQTERHFTFGPRKKFPDDINEVHDLYVTHLKGNTGVVFHASHADMTDPDNIVIRANDTLSAILLCNTKKLWNKVWLDSGIIIASLLTSKKLVIL